MTKVHRLTLLRERVASAPAGVRLRSIVLAAALLGLSALPLAASLASAQQPDAQDDRATSFHAVTSGAHEDVPGGTLLVAAYAVVLVALVGYVVYVAAMQQGTQREMSRLEKLVAARSAPPDRGDGIPVARATKD
jgi:CcmD family protein